MEALLQCVEAGSGRIIMVLGPRYSGKSAMLKQVKGLVEKRVYKFNMFGRSNFTKVENVLTMIEASSNCTNKEDIVIVDSAEELVRLGATQAVDRLKTISRDKKATVIMSTYSDLFREKWIGDDVDVVYVGHLSKAGARTFLCNALTQKPFGGFVSDKDWEQVYQVCGGCVLLLERAARAMLKGLDAIAEELDSLVASAGDVLRETLGRSKRGWEVGDLIKVAELMNQSRSQCGENGVVEWSIACERLFGGDEQKLKAMQADRVIHVQYAPASTPALATSTSVSDKLVKFIMPFFPPYFQAIHDVN